MLCIFHQNNIKKKKLTAEKKFLEDLGLLTKTQRWHSEVVYPELTSNTSFT